MKIKLNNEKNVEFESKINVDFKEKCMLEFSRMLDRLARHHNLAGSLDDKYKGIIGTEQPTHMNIEIELQWTKNTENKMFATGNVDLS